MTGQRRFSLRPWLIRALIPSHRVGTYVLSRQADVVYIGRSDTDLRRRLIEHALNRGASTYFTYAIHRSALMAYDDECSLFHAVGDRTTNIAHPQSPAGVTAPCGFCQANLAATRRDRLVSSSITHV